MKVLSNRNNVFASEEIWSFSDEIFYQLISYQTEAMSITYSSKRRTFEVHTFIENPSRTTRKHMNEFVRQVCDHFNLDENKTAEILKASYNKSFRRITINH